MDYATLKATIQSYTQNYDSDFEAAIPTFVDEAEQRIYNSVQLPTLRRNVTGVMSTGVKYLSCPGDFLSSFSMAVIDPVTQAQTYLLNKDVSFMREAYPEPAVLATPKYYALFDANTFILGPTPNAAYGVELHYYYYPPSIVTAGTSWLGDNFDSVLLYGSLVEAITFMKGEADMVALYDAKYKEALALLKRLGDGLDRQDSYRSGQVRIPVT